MLVKILLMCYYSNRERKMALNGQKRRAVFSSYKDINPKGTSVPFGFISWLGATGFEGRQAKLVLRRAADSTADLTAMAFAVNRARRTRRKSCHPSHIIWSISSVGRARDF